MTATSPPPRRMLTPGRAVFAVVITALASSLFLVFGVAHSRTPAPAAACADHEALWPELWHGFEVSPLRLH